MAYHVHDMAKGGFGKDSELYDRARPSYPPAAISHIRKAVNAPAPFNVAEIGAGSGIFTRKLLTSPDWAGAVKQLRAIEPSESMRAVFNKTIPDERVSAQEGTFQHTGIEDGWADLVVIAQAFHWCHPNYDEGIAEFARILKPNGVLALIWNLEDRDAAAWVGQLRNRIEQHERGTPQFRLGWWRAAYDTPSYERYFLPAKEENWVYQLEGTKDIVVDRACSKSYIATLSDSEKNEVRRDVSSIIDKGEGVTWMDKENGVFEYPYKTLVVIAKKK